MGTRGGRKGVRGVEWREVGADEIREKGKQVGG